MTVNKQKPTGNLSISAEVTYDNGKSYILSSHVDSHNNLQYHRVDEMLNGTMIRAFIKDANAAITGPIYNNFKESY